MKSRRPLRCLYYPYARSVNPRTLKRAALLFDEIWFSDPAGELQREILIEDDHSRQLDLAAQWELVRPAVNEMTEKGIVKIHDPRPEVGKYDNLLSVSLKEDMDDDEVWRVCSKPGLPTHWSMLRTRIPSSAFQFLGSQDSARVIWPTKAAREQFYGSGGGHLDRYRSIYHDAGISWLIENQMGDILQAGPSSIGAQVDPSLNGSLPLDTNLSCDFPFALGSSLAVNEAAVVAEEHGLAPLTDSPVHHSLMTRKFHRAKNNLDHGFFSDVGGIHPEKIRQIALTILDETVPNEVLDQVPLSEVVRYRKASEKSFERLKEYLVQVAVEVESEPWDRQFAKELQKTIHKKVIPEARAARDSAVSVYENLYGAAAKKLGPMAATTLSAGSYVGISLPQLLLLGSASAVGAVYPELVNSYTELRKTRRNSLTYLLNINQPSRKTWFRRRKGW